jgi:hypothetical protein
VPVFVIDSDMIHKTVQNPFDIPICQPTNQRLHKQHIPCCTDLGSAIMKWARLVVVSLGLLQGVQSQTNATIRLGMMVTPAGPLLASPAKFYSLFPEITPHRCSVPHKVADYDLGNLVL